MKKSILVCDDDIGILEVVSIILEQKGYCVTALNDSEDVLKTVEEQAPHLILLDLWMPNISGEELTLKLKKQKATKNIPVVIVSASKDTQKIATSAGANGFIVKPFDINDLESLVEKYIS